MSVPETTKACPIIVMRNRLDGVADRGELERIEREVEAEVHAAIASAKRAGFADIRKVISSNWSGEYASVVTRFTHSVTPSFGGGQSEARPGPF